ncbi:hypothetical protein EG68_01975 [Paragonimus skrjabini miyazakii]|uniref:Uncharacterized protein n=1 Tax=Paragonimus skrjabini miyazakii TaxID=59628 RepID=A0A8S9Z1F7_9TREM|nr:hypothetical protein EG68_01975 [Paragonimus skrjabini miyazakii]
MRLDSFLPALLLLSVITTIQPVLHWDYMVFTQQWTATFCTFKHCVRFPESKDFTIHGLWPNSWPSEEPKDCPIAPDFTQNVLEPIIDQLNEMWPDVLNSEDPFDFWKHEWYKHGRCAIEDELIGDELGYFNVSLGLKKRTPILQVLLQEGIEPSNYTVHKAEDIIAKLHKGFGTLPILSCMKKHKETAKLLEVRVCYNPSLELIDCVPNIHTQLESETISEEQVTNAVPCPSEVLLPEFT